MIRLYAALVWCFSVIWLPLFLVGLAIILPVARVVTELRQRASLRPRILRGTYALPDTYYKVAADHRLGYRSYLLVWQSSYYNRNWELPRYLQRYELICQILALPRYLGFLWSLLDFDIFQYYFDHQQLYYTICEPIELPLLRMAGKKIVMFPYGSDVLLPGTRAYGNLDFYELVAQDYPYQGTRWWRRKVERQIQRATRSANFIISCVPYLDVIPVSHLTRHYVAIDTAEWAVQIPPVRPIVKVVHASNHRYNKGTDLIVERCRN